MADSAAPAKLRFFDLTFYTVVATIGIRWLPVAAALGPASLPLWLVAFFTFYVPLAVATGELTARFPGEGSLYSWVRGTMGPFAAFVCGWFYWISLFPYFAGIVYFLSGIILSALGADTHNATLYLSLSVAIVVAATVLQLFGLRLGKWLTNVGASGSWLVFFCLLGAGIVLAMRHASATDFLHASYLPPASFDTAILWGTMVFALCGTETVGFLRESVEGGMRTILRVLVALGVAMVAIYAVGTAAMLVILPQAELTRLSGLPDALHAAFARTGAPSLAVVALALFALSSLGGLMAWFAIGIRLPMEAGIDNFLPPIFARKNPRTGVPVASVLLQGGLTLFIVVLSQAGAGAATAYDLLVSMSVLTVTIPYVFVFAAYLARGRWPRVPEAWIVPGGARVGAALGVVGMVATLTAIACTLVPSPTDAHAMATFLKIALSALAMLAAGSAFYWIRTRKVAQPA